MITCTSPARAAAGAFLSPAGSRILVMACAPAPERSPRKARLTRHRRRRRLPIVRRSTATWRGFIKTASTATRVSSTPAPSASCRRCRPSPGRASARRSRREGLSHRDSEPAVGRNGVAQAPPLGIRDRGLPRLNIWTPVSTTARKRPVMVWPARRRLLGRSSIELPFYDGENLARPATSWSSQ